MNNLEYSYNTFMLREKWTYSVAKNRFEYFSTSSLVPCQIVPFYAFFRDIELILNKRRIGEFYHLVIKLLDSKTVFWPFLLINIYYNGHLLSFYGSVPNVNCLRSEVIKDLSLERGKTNRTFSNAMASLLSTLEYSPIGSDLRIGIVRREGGDRSVKKEGSFPFNPFVTLYAVYRLAEKTEKYELTIKEVVKDQCGSQRVLLIEDII